ncbi:MAG: N-acetyl sugar amidotransferase [Phycisphaerae bacterium]|nr:N-acetyl sugar amidotransferase [Phycisphaerae bacterium]
MSERYSCEGYASAFRQRGRLCTHCVMDEGDPDLRFDEQGRCSGCREALAIEPAWRHTDAERSPEFDATVEAIRRQNARGAYDTILGLSGGVDSSWALVCAAKAGLRVLVMHCDTGWDSRESVDNIFNLCQRLGFALQTIVVDWESMRAAQRAFFLAGVANCDIPQDHAIIATVNDVAVRNGIRTFLSGGNWVGESILPDAWGHDALDIVHLRDVWKKAGDRHLMRRFPTFGTVRRHVINPFLRRMNAWRILDHLRYDPGEARACLEREYGWSSYGLKHCESVFTRVFQCVYLPMRFGFDKRRAHLASLVVSGLRSRDSALAELAQPPMSQDDAERGAEYLCSKLGFSAEEWRRMVTSPPVPHTRYRVDTLERLAVSWAKKHLAHRMKLRKVK